MNNAVIRKNRSGFLGDAFELSLFGIALFFLIPPVISNVYETPSFMTSRAFAIFAFALSRVVAVTRGKSSVIFATVELLLFGLFAWVLYLRLQAG